MPHVSSLECLVLEPPSRSLVRWGGVICTGQDLGGRTLPLGLPTSPRGFRISSVLKIKGNLLLPSHLPPHASCLVFESPSKGHSFQNPEFSPLEVRAPCSGLLQHLPGAPRPQASLPQAWRAEGRSDPE